MGGHKLVRHQGGWVAHHAPCTPCVTVRRAHGAVWSCSRPDAHGTMPVMTASCRQPQLMGSYACEHGQVPMAAQRLLQSVIPTGMQRSVQGVRGVMLPTTTHDEVILLLLLLILPCHSAPLRLLHADAELHGGPRAHHRRAGAVQQRGHVGRRGRLHEHQPQARIHGGAKRHALHGMHACMHVYLSACTRGRWGVHAPPHACALESRGWWRRAVA